MGLSQHKLCHLIQVVAMDPVLSTFILLVCQPWPYSEQHDAVPYKWMVHGQEPQEEILQELLLQVCPPIKLLYVSKKCSVFTGLVA